MEIQKRGALSIRETAVFLSLGRTSIYQLISSNELKTIKVGSRRLVRADSILAWLEANTLSDEES